MNATHTCRNWNRLFLVALTLLSLAGTARSLPAQEPKGISVQGTGKVEVLPDLAELSVYVSGEGELAADATKKFRDNKRRGVTALQNLKLAQMSVVDSGVAVNSNAITNQQQAFFNGNQTADTASKLNVGESLTIALAGVEKMKPEEVLDMTMKLVDTAKDAGLTVGPRPMTYYEMQMSYSQQIPSAVVNFRLKDFETHRTAAYAKAMEDARANAELLAKLAGVKLGTIRSISDKGNQQEFVTNDSNTVRRTPVYSSTSFKPIPVVVNLNVEFAIEAK